MFLRLVGLHFVVGLLYVAILGTNPADAIGSMFATFPTAFGFFVTKAWWAIAAFGLLIAVSDRRVLLPRIKPAIYVLIACNLFFLTFTMVKTTLPHVVGFWADPLFAAIDRTLHLGRDPWEWTHGLGDVVPLWLGEWLYMGLWLIPATYFPVFITLFDGDSQRRDRYLWLYLVGWAVLGNLMAQTFMSAGPIFYDRVYDGDRFAALMDTLRTGGVWNTGVAYIQDYLWSAYSTQNLRVGSGISAFPSVHVGMVTVWAFYLGERWKFTIPFGILLVAAFVFFSVHFGWHYAVDGYVSIVVIWAAWFMIRRMQIRHRHAANVALQRNNAVS